MHIKESKKLNSRQWLLATNSRLLFPKWCHIKKAMNGQNNLKVGGRFLI